MKETLPRYPVSIHLAGNRVVMVGGGGVAERRVAGLLAAGALLIVVSPELTPRLESLAGEGKILWVRRSYQAGDLTGARLAFGMAADPQVNQEVGREARSLGIWVNLGTDPDASDFHVPAVLSRGGIQVAIATNGSSPVLAAYVRRKLSLEIDEAYGVLARLLGQVRRALKEKGIRPNERARVLWLLTESDLLELVRAQMLRSRSERSWEEVNSLVREMSGLALFSYSDGDQ